MSAELHGADPSPPPSTSPLSEGQFRVLRLAVYGMGVLLIVGFLVIIGRIIYLMAQSPAPASAATTEAATALKSSAALTLPPGASIRHVSLAGNRLAVHYDAPAGSAILILDLASGSVVSRIAITSEGGR